MESVLYVSNNEINPELTKLLKMLGHDRICCAKSALEARRLINQEEYSLVIINSPLTDEIGYELAIFAVESNISGVAIMAKADACDVIEEKVEDFGIPVIAKPISAEYLYKNLKILKVIQHRVENLIYSNQKLEEKVREIKIVNRAKGLLIDNEHMNEEDAHKFIEKIAMNKRMTRKQVAEGIIAKYSNH